MQLVEEYRAAEKDSYVSWKAAVRDRVQYVRTHRPQAPAEAAADERAKPRAT